jgi:hypothetical protein
VVDLLVVYYPLLLLLLNMDDLLHLHPNLLFQQHLKDQHPLRVHHLLKLLD